MSRAHSLRSAALRLSMVCTAVLFAFPVTAAPPQRMDDPGTQYPEFAGGETHLPVNCLATPEELLVHARGMSMVRKAMDEFERRGYVPLPELDRAVNGCPKPTSLVGLVYRRPVAWLDSTHALQPLILIATRIHAWTGEPLTTVTAGLAVFDLERNLVFSGDSLDTLEPSFDVRMPGGGGGRSVFPELLLPEPERSRFARILEYQAFARCMHEQTYLPCDPPGYPSYPCNNWIEPFMACISNPYTRCLDVFF